MPTIQGEIPTPLPRLHLDDPPTRDLQDRAIRIAREREQLTTDLGRKPTRCICVHEVQAASSSRWSSRAGVRCVRAATRASVERSSQRGSRASRRPLLRFVRLSSERTLEPVRQDCSFAKKRQSHPALLLVVRRGVSSAPVDTPAWQRNSGAPAASCVARCSYSSEATTRSSSKSDPPATAPCSRCSRLDRSGAPAGRLVVPVRLALSRADLVRTASTRRCDSAGAKREIELADYGCDVALHGVLTLPRSAAIVKVAVSRPCRRARRVPARSVRRAGRHGPGVRASGRRPRVERRAAARELSDGFREAARLHDAVLEQVADPRSALQERLIRVTLLDRIERGRPGPLPSAEALSGRVAGACRRCKTRPAPARAAGREGRGGRCRS